MIQFVALVHYVFTLCFVGLLLDPLYFYEINRLLHVRLSVFSSVSLSLCLTCFLIYFLSSYALHDFRQLIRQLL